MVTNQHERTSVRRVVLGSMETDGVELLTCDMWSVHGQPTLYVFEAFHKSDAPRNVERTLPDSEEAPQGSIQAELGQWCQQYPGQHKVLVLPQGSSTPSEIPKAIDAIVRVGTSSTTSIDIVQRRPTIHIPEPRCTSDQDTETEPRAFLRVGLVSGRLAMHVYTSCVQPQKSLNRENCITYDDALSASNDPSSFLEYVAFGVDDIGSFLFLNFSRGGGLHRKGKNEMDITANWNKPASAFDFDPKKSVHSLILRHELSRRGVESEWVASNSLVGEQAGVPFAFHVTSSPCSAQPAAMATDDKDVARTILKAAKISVAEGSRFYDKNEISEGLALFRKLPSAVVKPLKGAKGRGVTVDIRDEDDFVRAWYNAFALSPRGILVEEFFEGEEFRFVVVNNECLAAIARRPPMVTGNGRSTIRDLINEKNAKRRQNPNLAKRPIVMDSSRMSKLHGHGNTLNSVLPQGSEYVIDYKGGLSTGAESRDVSDEVHSSYKEVAAAAVCAFPGLGIAGVDILLVSPNEEASHGNYIVLELNSQPGIGGHHFPAQGSARNIGGPLVDMVLGNVEAQAIRKQGVTLQSRKKFRVPRNNRLLAREFSAMGFSVNRLSERYFLASLSSKSTSVWDTYTQLTGKNAVAATRNLTASQNLLDRTLTPQASKRIFSADGRAVNSVQYTRALDFAESLGMVNMRAFTQEGTIVDPADRSAFIETWNRISSTSSSILIEHCVGAFRLKWLVAYGKVLGAALPPNEMSERLVGYVDSSYMHSALRASEAFPGLDICEVFIDAVDFSVPANLSNHAVGVVRPRPDISSFFGGFFVSDDDIFREVVELHVSKLH